jgi:PBP1b-binding outer membrane lipoprotein LpoB
MKKITSVLAMISLAMLLSFCSSEEVKTTPEATPAAPAAPAKAAEPAKAPAKK